jgi:hypothetical protein
LRNLLTTIRRQIRPGRLLYQRPKNGASCESIGGSNLSRSARQHGAQDRLPARGTGGALLCLLRIRQPNHPRIAQGSSEAPGTLIDCARLIADWLMSQRCPARVTWRSSSSAYNGSTRLRSKVSDMRKLHGPHPKCAFSEWSDPAHRRGRLEQCIVWIGVRQRFQRFFARGSSLE